MCLSEFMVCSLRVRFSSGIVDPVDVSLLRKLEGGEGWAGACRLGSVLAVMYHLLSYLIHTLRHISPISDDRWFVTPVRVVDVSSGHGL